MDLSACQHENTRIAQSIYDCMDFGGSSSTTNTNRLVLGVVHVPFFAPALALCALI